MDRHAWVHYTRTRPFYIIHTANIIERVLFLAHAQYVYKLTIFIFNEGNTLVILVRFKHSLYFLELQYTIYGRNLKSHEILARKYL